MIEDALEAREVDLMELPLRVGSAEIERLAAIIDALRAAKRLRPASQSLAVGGSQTPLSLAQSIYRFRRQREKTFGPKLFSDPAWDILLDLYIAREEGRKISISSACIGSNAPSTTALRHLSVLVKNELLQRRTNEADARGAWIELTELGQQKVEEVLHAWSL